MASNRQMPPWLPAPEVGDFANERRLSEAEITTLRRWADARAPQGDPVASPAAPAVPSEWSFGEPDLIVDFAEYTVPSEGRDLYRNLVAPIPIDEARWVRAVELRPGAPRVVHHARMMVDATESSREQAALDVEGDVDRMHVSASARNPEGFFVGWTPGGVADVGREDLAWLVRPGTDLVFQLHLRPTGRPEPVRPQAGFHFADAPPTRTPALVMLESRSIDILPGDTAFVAEDHYRLPVSVEVLSVYPHAHYLGKRLEAWAVLPDGRRNDLIRIEDWDFDWQDEYRYRRPERLPAGSVVTMHFTYDNSSANPRNPFDPPRRIVRGLGSTDEMAELTLQVLPTDPADLATLKADLDRFYYEGETKWEAAGHLARARNLEEEGQLAEALEAYRQALLMGDDPSVMASMANVLLLQEDAAAAILVAQRAAALSNGTDARILWVLARAYAGAGRTEQARDVAARAGAIATREGLTALADSLAAFRRSIGS
jgi:hypothetical protein